MQLEVRLPAQSDEKHCGETMGLSGLERISAFTSTSQLYASYGVQVNELSVDEVFGLYQRTGFLYPEKAARLRPQWARIRENWRRMMRGRDPLLSVLTAGDQAEGRASLAVWRTTLNGWVLQHLVSEDNPLASRAVMLASGAASLLKGTNASGQNWFRPENRFPARVFGSMVQSVGGDCSSVKRHSYVALPRQLSLAKTGNIAVVPFDASHKKALCAFASAERGDVYVAGEDLSGDVNCEAIDELYRQVGLRRSRRVWLAYRKHTDEPIGAVIAYRGPLGINFSYLENRSDLLISKHLDPAEVSDVASSLLSVCTGFYQDFELDEIPVITDDRTAQALVKVGANFVRNYFQGIWLRDGYPRFYRHIDAFYERLLTRIDKYSSQQTLVRAQ
jgi:hypothetical protein